jgi:hypothetical protein
MAGPPVKAFGAREERATIAPDHLSHRRNRCRYCSRVRPAWLPAAQRPTGAMRRPHLGDRHPEQVRPSLTRMRTEDIATVAAEAYEVVEEDTAGEEKPRWPHNP